MERIFYNSGIVDPSSGLPVYLFDTSYLPSPDLINYDAFIPTLMNRLPQHQYALVMFNCGLNKISWIWGVKFLKEFLDNNPTNLDLLKIVYTVHDSWFIKLLTQIFTTKKNIGTFQKMIDLFDLTGEKKTKKNPERRSVSTSNIGERNANKDRTASGSNFSTSNNRINDMEEKLDTFKSFSSSTLALLFSSSRSIIRCSTLSELSRYMDITKLKISLNIYKHDMQLEDGIRAIGAPNIIGTSGMNKTTNPLYYHHFYQIFNILDTYSPKAELVFYKLGNRKSTDILYSCVSRNQVVWINDWDLWCIGGCFKKFLSSFSKPLIPISNILLPMSDNLEYTSSKFYDIVELHRQQGNLYEKIVFQLMGLCTKIMKSSEATKHTSLTLLKALVHCLSHEVILLTNKDKVAIGQRFLKNLLENWPEIAAKSPYKYPTINEEELYSKNPVDQMYNSYDVSYDLTMDDDEEDLEYRVAFNTTNILSDSNLKNKKIPPPPTASPRRARAVPAVEHSRSRSASPKKDTRIQDIKKRNFKEDKKIKDIDRKLETLNIKEDIQVKIDSKKEGIIERNVEMRKVFTDKLNLTLKPQASTPSLDPVVKHVSANPKTSQINKMEVSSEAEPVKKLKDVSNIVLQKQKFKIPEPVIYQPLKSNISELTSSLKTPVIRGRKVRELARLFEERAEALELIKTM